MAATGAGPTVLVVAEEGEARETMTEALALHGFTVVEAVHGPEALLALRRLRPEAVVLDLDMPRLGGLEALRQIRARAPAIAILAVTREADDEFCWRALACGADDVLAKPVVAADLVDAVETARRAERGRAPAPAEGPARAVAPARTEGPPRGADRPSRALVVEGDADARRALEAFLAARGYAVRAAADLEGAERAVLEAPPDVVLFDLALAGLDALEALAAVRALAPHAAVLLTGTVAEHELARRAFARGAFDYVGKPLDLEQLGQSLELAATMRRLAAEP